MSKAAPVIRGRAAARVYATRRDGAKPLNTEASHSHCPAEAVNFFCRTPSAGVARPKAFRVLFFSFFHFIQRRPPARRAPGRSQMWAAYRFVFVFTPGFLPGFYTVFFFVARRTYLFFFRLRRRFFRFRRFRLRFRTGFFVFLS